MGRKVLLPAMRSVAGSSLGYVKLVQPAAGRIDSRRVRYAAASIASRP